jgi:tyrosine-protein kinase Etk/Wzc
MHSQAASDGRGLELLDVLVTLRGQWKRHLLIPLACAATAVGLSFLVRSTFTATTTIIPPQQQGATSALLGSLGGLGAAAALSGGSLKNPTDQWISFARSRTVQDALIATFDLQKAYEEDMLFKAREALESRTKITAGKDGLIQIEVEDHDPDRAARVANGYVEQLNKLNSTLAVTEASQRRKFFEDQLKAGKKALADAEAGLRAAGVNPSILRTTPETAVTEVAQLKSQLTALEVRLAVMRETMTSNNPEYRQTQREMQSLQERLQANARPGSSAASDAGSEYIAKYREFKYQETLFELLARQYEMARSDEAREGMLIQVVDKAVTPEWKTRPKRGLIGAITFLLTLVLAVAATVLRLVVQHNAADDPVYAQKIRALSGHH